MNESVTVRSEERGIYTLNRNLTVQIYVGSFDTDLETSDINRKHYSHGVKSQCEQVNIGTLGKRRDFQRAQLRTQLARNRYRDSRHGSGVPTVETFDVHRQPASRTTDAGTPGLGRDFRLSGVPTHVGTSDVHSHRTGSDWESALPTRVMTSDCREFRLTSRLSTPTITENNLRARGVLEFLSFDFILMLEHSIFLRPTKFASLFIVRRILNSKIKLKPLESVLSLSAFSTSRIEEYHFIFINSLNLSWD